MDVVGEGTIQLSDMVTMRGDGVSLANSGGQSNGVVGVGVSGGSGSGSSGIIGESKTLATIHNNNNNTNNNNQALVECHSNGTTSSATNGDAQWKMVPQDSSKMNKIREIVENSASVASKCLVEGLLQQVGQLSDIEKFLLYLKLPVGRPPDSDPLKQPLNPLGSRCEIQLTITWIRTHLEMNSEVSLPKREVYNEYMHYCNMNNIKALSTADFGKVMKQVFPGVRPRRLGQRGASKYCYSGLRKKWSLDPPELPDLNDNVTKKNMLGVDGVADESEVERAAGCLVMEWAEKLCSVKFECLRDLALHLVHKNYVDNRSMAAFTLLSVANQKQGMLMSGGGSNGGKHRETQLQLQRKLQEREQIREQKRKLQEQQPAITKCANERPKSRRRSAASRNPSGETVTNGAAISTPNTQNNKTGVGINHSSGSSLPSAVSATATASNGNCDSLASELPNGATTNDITGGESNNVIGLMSIKQEQTFKQEQSLDFLDSFCEDKSVLDGKNDTFNSNLITTGSHSLPPGRKNCNSNVKNNFNSECNKPSSNKISISKPNPSKKSFLIMPSPGSKTTSPKPRFKAIQPKVSDGFQGLVSGGSQWSDVLGGNSEESAHSRTEVSLGVTGVGDLVTSQQPVSKEPYQQGLLPNNNNVNSHEADDELMQYVNKQATVDMDDAQKSSQLSELRKLLQRNLPSNNVGNTRSHLTDSDMVDQEATGAGGMRRRVSFQPSIDGGDVLNPLMGGQTVGSVPPSPNTRRTQFNFTPIGNNVDQVQGMSQCSSTNASPFMSPRNTPLPRSRHNSGQTSSTYVTPRSTPFTPDQPVYPVASESSTPFMSPIATPMYPRSRHNSSQNLRTPYTPTCRSRHSSGAPTFRHAPYAADELSNRRGGKFRSRHSSGSVPPSPSSAPLSPLVQDIPVPPQDSLSLQLPSMLHHMLKNKQPVTGYTDLRRRHMSAGPTIHYQPQPPAFQPDPLSQEISNVLTNPQAGPSNAPQGSSNRPQSVPLLQMLNIPCNPESFPKSHPNTPVVNQQFSFSDCCTSQPSSYAPTPVPSEYSDFIETYSLDIDPMLDGGLPNDSGGGAVGLESVDPLALSGSHSSDLSTLSDPLQVPPNVNPFSDYQTDCISARPFDTSRSDDVLEGNSCCLDNTVTQNTNTNTSEVLIGTSSMLTLNALNRSGHESGTGGLEEDFQPTLADLGDQEVFNSLVLDVNKD
ncbi:uncharacterized protein LOC135204195 isoform X2 [Macrobrachium nipponense]|uniref:uncharacterized protein LOC135204195 isoform X2 n=1 Tax=Macrobrachium nipponense TaxID=159736 RepID=UPI0030C843BF